MDTGGHGCSVLQLSGSISVTWDLDEMQILGLPRAQLWGWADHRGCNALQVTQMPLEIKNPGCPVRTTCRTLKTSN